MLSESLINIGVGKTKGFMMDIAEQVKEQIRIEDVIEETYPLRGSGRYLKAEAHDSLVVDLHAQMYNWNSRGEDGDVITWVMKRQKTDFKGAMRVLCERIGIEYEQWDERDAARAAAARVRADALTIACRYWAKRLRESEEGLSYALSRWDEETITGAGLGYIDRDKQALRGELSMHGVDLDSGVAKAILKAPAGHLVYPHIVQGRVVYFSTRRASTEEKGHWNPPADLAGDRQPFFNVEYSPRADLVVVVEGQADAVTLGAFGYTAVALAGCSADVSLLKALGRHGVVALGLDADQAGQANTAKIADALGPMTRIVRWPRGDANAWAQAGATQENVQTLIQDSPRWIFILAQAVAEADELEYEERLRRFFSMASRMTDFEIELHKKRLAELMGIGVRQFNGMLKTTRQEQEEDEDEDGPAGIVAIPGGYICEHLMEMIVEPPKNGDANSPRAQWKTRFAVRYPDGEIKEVDYLELDNVRFVPVPPESRIVTERVVQFPSQVDEYGSLRELMDEVRMLIHKYMDLDVFYEHLASYYVLFSWLYDSFNTVAYLRMLGDAGTGKSRFLQVVGALCYRPIFVTGAATVSPIFRILDAYRGTLVLDEGDYKASDEAADIIKILNTGYQRQQGVVLRSGDKNSGFEPEVYVVYGPKVIATRKRFQDWALESRCLTNEAGGPTTRSDIPIDLPRDFWRVEAVQMRNKLLRYRLENWVPEIELDYSQLEASVEPRLNQITVALQTLIDDQELRGDLQSFIREYNAQLIAERGMTITAKILEALVGLRQLEQQVTGEDDPALAVGKVTEATNILIDMENKGADQDLDKFQENRKGITPHKVGHQLRKELHLRTDRDSRVGRAYAVVWEEERIASLRKRFGIEEEWLGHVVETLRDVMYPNAPKDEDIPSEVDADGIPLAF